MKDKSKRAMHSGYFAVLPILVQSDGLVRTDNDTTVLCRDREFAIEVAEWLVVDGGWIGAIVFRRQFDEAGGPFEKVEIVQRIGSFSDRLQP